MFICRSSSSLHFVYFNFFGFFEIWSLSTRSELCSVCLGSFPVMLKGNKQQKASVSKYICRLVSRLLLAFCRAMDSKGRAHVASCLGVICLFLSLFCFQSSLNASINTTLQSHFN